MIKYHNHKVKKNNINIMYIIKYCIIFGNLYIIVLKKGII